MIFSGDCRPGEPDHGAEQRDGRAEGGEQRKPQRDQQVDRNLEILKSNLRLKKREKLTIISRSIDNRKYE